MNACTHQARFNELRVGVMVYIHHAYTSIDMGLPNKVCWSRSTIFCRWSYLRHSTVLFKTEVLDEGGLESCLRSTGPDDLASSTDT